MTTPNNLTHCPVCGVRWEVHPTPNVCRTAPDKAALPYDEDDMCGLCGLPGADKYAHPVHWPGERVPDGQFVHESCEAEECARAHAALTDEQRKSFLRSL